MRLSNRKAPALRKLGSHELGYLLCSRVDDAKKQGDF